MDEFHYMNDNDRGIVWEEAVMFTPGHIQLLPLSATIGNANKLTRWMNNINQSRPTALVEVPSGNRHVPLIYYGSSGSRQIPLMSNNVDINTLCGQSLSSQPVQTALDNQQVQKALELIAEKANVGSNAKDGYSELQRAFNNRHQVSKQDFIGYLQEKGFSVIERTSILDAFFKKTLNPKIAKITTNIVEQKAGKKEPVSLISQAINTLQREDKLPAIMFIFSKKGCNQAVYDYLHAGRPLLNESEVKKANTIIRKFKDSGVFAGEEFDQKAEEALLLGVAPHHAGLYLDTRVWLKNYLKIDLLKLYFLLKLLQRELTCLQEQ